MFDLNNKRIFVAGHKGMVGSSITNELYSLNLEVLTAEKNELDLRTKNEVNIAPKMSPGIPQGAPIGCAYSDENVTHISEVP